MNLFLIILQLLGPDFAFRLINAARPGTALLFSQILPERNLNTYHVERGSMTIRSTMAGLVGMDSPYPEGGALSVSDFMEKTAKIAIANRLTEEALRIIQAMVTQIQGAGQSPNQALVEEALNFTNHLLIQPHLDTMEWLRAQAMCTGKIDWTFNSKALQVDYGVPSNHKLARRTGNDSYGGSASKWWADQRQARKLLKGNVRAFIGHPDTVQSIIDNPANALQVVNETDSLVTIRKVVGSLERPSEDARDTTTIIKYGAEGEVWDPAKPGKTKPIPFVPLGKIAVFANNSGTNYVVGAGATPPVEGALGYTHIGPTVEGGGRPGRWSRVFVPEQRQWGLEGEAVCNGLPVIETPDKIVILDTEVA